MLESLYIGENVSCRITHRGILSRFSLRQHHVLWNGAVSILSIRSLYITTMIFFFVFPLSCPALWQQNCNLNYLLCQTDLLCQGKLYKCKAPLDAHQLPIYLFLLQYFTCNSAEPDRGTRKEEEQRKGEKETEQK